ncbi:2-hydroxyacid dehydrogenase [Flaviflexus huanghaiensis]|uniref:2-hydroxyacid dehydrogenase n=1 Tax=Flaviflexus huanghaiensis TaxID=1111473 RepID=UPI0015F84C5E|nr:2-hydroxyacid dehydrogenase [Flaviflexus huanghaiensis]
MKVLAIADAYIPLDMLRDGTGALVDAGHDVTYVEWETESIEKLQEVNLLVEQKGPNGLELPDSVAEKVRESDIVITQFAPIGAALIESSPNLKVIGVLRGGTENVDSAATQRAGITVLNTAGRNARAVAEFTVGLILAETRNIARTHAAMREHVWLKDFPNGDAIPELEGRTIGLVGAGAIGQLVMKFLAGMDARCRFYDPYQDTSEYGDKVDSLEELMSTSDIITIHSRLTPDNHLVVSRDMLALMQPHAVLVNTARSGLVDEEALLEALRERKIAGAAIDTFDIEPLPADSEWLTLDNVTITSHLAGSTRDAFVKTPRMLSERLLAHLTER